MFWQKHNLSKLKLVKTKTQRLIRLEKYQRRLKLVLMN